MAYLALAIKVLPFQFNFRVYFSSHHFLNLQCCTPYEGNQTTVSYWFLIQAQKATSITDTYGP